LCCVIKLFVLVSIQLIIALLVFLLTLLLQISIKVICHQAHSTAQHGMGNNRVRANNLAQHSTCAVWHTKALQLWQGKQHGKKQLRMYCGQQHATWHLDVTT
jgi:hypothetical protein